MCLVDNKKGKLNEINQCIENAKVGKCVTIYLVQRRTAGQKVPANCTQKTNT